MSKNSADSRNAEFEIRVRQAIRSARNNLPQVAVLIFSFDRTIDGSLLPEGYLPAFQSSILMRLKSGLRETDSVARLDNGHLAVLLESVQGPQDLDLVITRLLSRLDDPVQIDEISIALEPQIGSVKDMGSAAVGLALLIAAAVWLLALAERFGLL